MSALMWLAPLSLFLGGMGLLAFLWTFRAGQYEDPKGAAARILDDHLDAGPPPRAFPGSDEPGKAPDFLAGARPLRRTGFHFAGTRSRARR